ncbi:hypothetical protein Hdeb2414_s0008g00286861 [Helianthus debilis subsp. tardiflorus]
MLDLCCLEGLKAVLMGPGLGTELVNSKQAQSSLINTVYVDHLRSFHAQTLKKGGRPTKKCEVTKRGLSSFVKLRKEVPNASILSIYNVPSKIVYIALRMINKKNLPLIKTSPTRNVVIRMIHLKSPLKRGDY